MAFDRRRATGRYRITLAALAASGLMLAGCSAAPDSGTAAHADLVGDSSGPASNPLPTTDADWKPVADTLGHTGTVMNKTVFRVPLPRKDLTVTTQGVTVKPGLSLGGYATFAKYPDATMLMGDLVVAEDELQKVTGALQAAGIEQTGVHKHLLQQSPAIWWTHIHAMGNPTTLAQGLKAALAATSTPPSSPPPSPQPPIDLDTAAIDAALGRKGTADGGIYKFSVGRKDAVTDGGHVLPPGLGITTVINFQPLGGRKAAVNGDFVMTADEVQRVIQALHKGGISIVEVHNHSLTEQPRLFYLHFWATGDGASLAEQLRPALNATKFAPPTS